MSKPLKDKSVLVQFLAWWFSVANDDDADDAEFEALLEVVLTWWFMQHRPAPGSIAQLQIQLSPPVPAKP